ncbi:MAG TPA: hypothetical protein VE955_00480 [Candidatus Dormibacteraeota bacterium]|nr:hypothetical protein [Candidatus Dormibacteraeota bacterium]
MLSTVVAKGSGQIVWNARVSVEYGEEERLGILANYCDRVVVFAAFDQFESTAQGNL